MASLRRWGEAGVHLAPIRHHSPGCAAALRALLDEVRPATVLIEGPREYGALLDALTDEQTRPPVAVLSLDGPHAAFYPLAEFSPEWVALRWGAENDATVDFIDQSWADQARVESDDDPGAVVRTLQAERHLAQSRAIAALAADLGCRDHDDVWEHLFELRGGDELHRWREYFQAVLGWAALARLETERAVLDADGTHGREAVMAAMLARHRAADRGAIVVVTGAFHTLGLLEALDDREEGRWITSHRLGALDVARPAWLIRYDFTRLDGLRGYGAGMPAPGFWQRAWEGRASGDDGRRLAVEVLLDVAAELRAQGEQLSVADVTAAAEQALRLADLRGRAWPGRTDLLDAMLSCFVKDDGGLGGPLGRAIDAVFGGTALGELPPGVEAVPLVAEVRAIASKLRFVIDDGATRAVSLDTARKPAHVRRREFLATMRFIGSRFTRQLGGPDLVAGTGLGVLHEEWEYAWTPMVEAALIEVSREGATLEDVRRRRIAQRLEGREADAGAVSETLSELAVMGAAEELPSVMGVLEAAYDADPQLGSVVASLHRVMALLVERGRLALGDQEKALRRPLRVGLASAAYQLAQVDAVDDANAGSVCDAVLSLRDLLRRLDVVDLVDDAAGVRRELTRLRQRETSARLHGCLVAVAYAADEIDAGELRSEVAAHLHPGADPDRLAAFLLGLMQASPDLVLHSPELLEALNDSLAEMEDGAFLSVLPDLRQAFTWLRPSETNRLASAVAQLTSADVRQFDAVLRIDPALAAEARRVEQELLAGFARDHVRVPS
ncbi:DUF5682 family protein [Tessaracoccus caeni]|uniref:DUF5682 family protein n=1 Tax=Tessaracoccus caeni TaxID=3031239 RepID=UPI0023DCDD32|nr:DUF5682 family protein [Tessaracoccus caeni]MDF1488948.1 DUF5682 family protein [Tessaracoccus caeni]